MNLSEQHAGGEAKQPPFERKRWADTKWENALQLFSIETNADINVDWHAGIYPEERTTLKLDLYHVRAAAGIEIEYHSERDGWVIFQTVTTGYEKRGDISEPVEKRKELAFIPAWDTEEFFIEKER